MIGCMVSLIDFSGFSFSSPVLFHRITLKMSNPYGYDSYYYYDPYYESFDSAANNYQESDNTVEND